MLPVTGNVDFPHLLAITKCDESRHVKPVRSRFVVVAPCDVFEREAHMCQPLSNSTVVRCLFGLRERRKEADDERPRHLYGDTADVRTVASFLGRGGHADYGECQSELRV